MNLISAEAKIQGFLATFWKTILKKQFLIIIFKNSSQLFLGTKHYFKTQT